jgi:two-component system, cell cycle sensor histidine kinase and response regulator CckA
VEELRESEARSRIVMETVADAVVTVDEGGRILFVNGAAGRVFGYGAGEMLGSNLTMLMPEYMRRLHEEGMGRYIETGVKHISWEGVELPGLHRAGHEVPLEVSFGEFNFGGRRYFTGVIRDITERKRAERRQAAQYEVTRALAEARTLKEVVPHVMRAVCEGLDWDYGALWRVERGGRTRGGGRAEPEDERLRFIEAWHGEKVRAAEVEKFSRQRDFGRGEGLLSAKVWGEERALWVEDVASDPTFLRAAAAAKDGLHAALAFPILLHGEVLGVMEFFSREVRAPDESMLRMLAQVGSQLGQVIERRRAEEEQARLREEIIRVQDELLAELSSPLVPLTPEIVLMPLVGAVDAKRARRVIESLLAGLERERAAVAIIDITGVPVVDAHVADTLVRASQAARLLGTEVILTGIRAGVARSLVGLGLDLHAVATRKTLQEGIRRAFEHLRARATNL